ncbi:Hypothetical predicted protein, partial [Marmota monax]
MLKVSVGLVLLCGLLGSLEAQQLLNEVTQRLVSAGFLATAGSTSFQRWLNRAFYRNASPQDLLGSLLFRANGNLGIQVKDTQLLQVSLEVSAASNEAYLRVPLLFGVVINSLTFNVRADILVQLTLEKDLEDRYILAFRDCRLLPQFLQIQPENPTPFLEGPVRAALAEPPPTRAHDLAFQMCPVIDRALSGLSPEVVNEII